MGKAPQPVNLWKVFDVGSIRASAGPRIMVKIRENAGKMLYCENDTRTS